MTKSTEQYLYISEVQVRAKVLVGRNFTTAIPVKRDEVQVFHYHISQCATDGFSILLLRHEGLLLSYK